LKKVLQVWGDYPFHYRAQESLQSRFSPRFCEPVSLYLSRMDAADRCRHDFGKENLKLMTRKTFGFLATLLLTGISAWNQAAPPPSAAAITIYNQQFAVVRHTLPLTLKAGANHVEITDITSHLEPDSVILSPLDKQRSLQILEQNYRNDPVSQQLLLSLYEGKTIDFEITDKDGNKKTIQGKIIRSGYVPHYGAYSQYGSDYYAAQNAMVQAGADQPIIEVNGKLQFSLPGMPVFPALADDTILKPTLSWEIETNQSGPTNAEFSYVTGGMNWHADYNVVAPPKGDTLEMVGWVTLDNQSGKTFPLAHIKLLAGDVSKLQPSGGDRDALAYNGALQEKAAAPGVRERSFDEYHLYTLERPTTLHDRETKQVEFVRASGIQSKRVYVYDGLKIEPGYVGYPMESIRANESYGTGSNPKIWVMQEFKNSKANNLGMPLPKGRVRFYRRDEDGQMEFTGENTIDHTPSDETIRLYTGNAFDVVGERHRTYFRIDQREKWVDETFEIKLRNHKKEPVNVRVVEHLYRWSNWEISQKSDPYNKVDSQTIEFIVQVAPDAAKSLTYTVHYSW